MLASVMIGGNSIKAMNNWSIVDNGPNARFLANDEIGQRIRLHQRIPEGAALKSVNSEDDRIKLYHQPAGRWVNNMKNLNPMLVVAKDEHMESHIVYVTLSTEYRMTMFNPWMPIVGTYHKKDMYNGCVIAFSEMALNVSKGSAKKEDYGSILDIFAQHVKSKKFYKFSIIVDDVKECKVRIVREEIKNAKMTAKMMHSIKKHPKAVLGFKVSASEVPMTSTCIFSDELLTVEDCEKLIPANDDVAKIIDDMKEAAAKPIFISTTSESMTDDDVVKCLLESKIRAVTVVGFSENDECIKRLAKRAKLLYIFRYDMDSKTYVSKKNN